MIITATDTSGFSLGGDGLCSDWRIVWTPVLFLYIQIQCLITKVSGCDSENCEQMYLRNAYKSSPIQYVRNLKLIVDNKEQGCPNFANIFTETYNKSNLTIYGKNSSARSIRRRLLNLSLSCSTPSTKF